MLKIVGNQKIPMKKNSMRVSGTKVYKTKDVKAFEMYLSWAATIAMKKQSWSRTDKPVSLHLDVVFGDQRRRDLQNCFGAVCDALNEIVYDDDCQIEQLSATKQYIKNEWSFIITVEVL